MKINRLPKCFDMLMDKVYGMFSVILLELKLDLNFLSKDLYFSKFFLRFPEGKRIEDCKPKRKSL